jgi:hypothetical protein
MSGVKGKSTSAKVLAFRGWSVSTFTHFIAAKHCRVVQVRAGRFVRSIHWPIRKRVDRHGFGIGPVYVAFGVLDCGQGWSRRYRGFRLLWRGNSIARVRLGRVV